MPFFSVLMPSRNRVSLLKVAVPTAINQEFDDYEIIVSNNNSSDGTEEVGRAFAAQSSKVRFFSTGRDLSMLDHFEFIVSKASGKYIICLCDDDALAPNSLSYLHQLLVQFPTNVLTWSHASYGHPDIPIGDESRCTLSYHHTSKNLFQVDSRPMMEALCNFDVMVYGVVPKIINSAISLEQIRKCSEKTGGRFFVPPYPDFSTACHLLGSNSSYLFIDLPMYIAGDSKLSNTGLRYMRKEKTDDYISLFDRDLLEGVPYPMKYLVTPYLCATWLLFQRVYPHTFPSQINLDAYLRALFNELTSFEAYEDLTEEFELLSAYMKDYSGSGAMFERLWREYQQAKTIQGPVSFTQQLKRKGWDFVRKNQRAYEFVARARGHKLQASSHKNVPSIGAAANILSGYLTKQARPVAELSPVQVSSPNFLQGQQ
jgi:glycosyltransferase involved in cell wall biosynthesis